MPLFSSMVAVALAMSLCSCSRPLVQLEFLYKAAHCTLHAKLRP